MRCALWQARTHGSVTDSRNRGDRSTRARLKPSRGQSAKAAVSAVTFCNENRASCWCSAPASCGGSRGKGETGCRRHAREVRAAKRRRPRQRPARDLARDRPVRPVAGEILREGGVLRRNRATRPLRARRAPCGGWARATSGSWQKALSHSGNGPWTGEWRTSPRSFQSAPLGLHLGLHFRNGRHCGIMIP